MELSNEIKFPIYLNHSYISDTGEEKIKLIIVSGSVDDILNNNAIIGRFYLDMSSGIIYRYARYVNNNITTPLPLIFVSNGELLKVLPDGMTEDNMKDSNFHISNCYDIEVETISKTTIPDNVQLVSDRLIRESATQSSNNEYFPIKDTDDVLKRLIKSYFISHRTVPSSIKAQFNFVNDETKRKGALYNNIMSTLKKDTKLSIIYFMMLVKALDANFEIRMWDNSYKDNPPENKVLRYTSWDDKISSSLPLNIPIYTSEDEDEV